MKAMEIDSSGWTDEMRKNAVRKLEELGYKNIDARRGDIGRLSITAYPSGWYVLYDCTAFLHEDFYLPTYEQLMAMTKEDVI